VSCIARDAPARQRDAGERWLGLAAFRVSAPPGSVATQAPARRPSFGRRDPRTLAA